MKKTHIIGGIILLIVLTTGILICISRYLSHEQSNQEWLTYKNSRYDFELSYPPDWQLGEPEIGNAGRTFKDPETDVECYAYGFANVIPGKTAESQTLDEFIDWLLNDPQDLQLIERKEKKISDFPAVYLLVKDETLVRESVYVLGNETGIGLFCTYKNLTEKEKYDQTFNKMVAGMKIYADLDGVVLHTGVSDCRNLLSGAIEPLKDFQTFIDDEYTEVTTTSREYWDKDRLPKAVLELEEKEYTCYPAPSEFDYITDEPVVTKVEWRCELGYEDWKYLPEEDTQQKTELEKQNYDCKTEECFGEGMEINKIWFCSKESKVIAPSPTEVVSFYLYSTLGSLEGAEIDYDKAKEYLTPELKQEFIDPMFIPASYCIQDGPDEVYIHKKEQLMPDSVNVKVSALYSEEWSEMWGFILTPDEENPDNDWLISEIVCLEEANY